MGQMQRAGYMDVSNSIDVSNAGAVAAAVSSMLLRVNEGIDTGTLERLFLDFERLYKGQYPGFHGCELRYHNAQHVLDVTLAMARLLDGYSIRHGRGELFSEDDLLAGIAAALFHDAGYIRRRNDTRHSNGAAYTRVHVTRSARFLREYLPTIGLAHLTQPCMRLVHFTGYEISPDEIPVSGDTEYLLGTFLGTADLIAQMADIDYVRKCREYLYEEFVIGGMAGEKGVFTHTGTIYRSPEQLLSLTPSFIRSAIDVRLEGHFNGAHRYAADHFGGQDLYLSAIMDNCRSLESILSREQA